MSGMVDKFEMLALYDARMMFRDRGWGLRPEMVGDGEGEYLSEWRPVGAGGLDEESCEGCSEKVGPLGWIRSVGRDGDWMYCAGCASSEMKVASDADALNVVVEFYDLTENEFYPVRVDDANRVRPEDVM